MTIFQTGQQAYTQASGTTPTQPLVIEKRNPTVNDTNYRIGTFWLDTTNSSLWFLDSLSSNQALLQAMWVQVENHLDSLEFLTGDTGGPVGPDINQNINVKALYTNSVVGDPSTNTLTVTPTVRGYPTSPYVVGPSTFAGYQTIQSAINAAGSAGGGTVFIQPGTYTENPTMVAGVNLTAYTCDATTPSVTILGTVTANYMGSASISGINLQTNGSSALSVGGSGGILLLIDDCQISATNSTAIVINNTSSGVIFSRCRCQIDASEALFNIINGGVEFNYSRLHQGTTTASTCGGPNSLEFFNSTVNVPVVSSGAINVSYFNCNSDTSSNATCLTTAGTGTANITNCWFNSGTGSSISIGSGTTVTLTSSTITSSNIDPITGSGALVIGGITFNGSTAISGTVSSSGSGGFMPGTFGTAGQIFTSNGPGIIPTFQNSATISQVIVTTFTTSGTYTPNPGLNYATFEVVGAGGGGGGVAATTSPSISCGGGGGGGGYARKTLSLASIGGPQTVTVGAGGAGGASGGGSGVTGGTSSVGSLVSATGGVGGNFAGVSGGVYVQSVPGGMGINGDLNCSGGAGFPAGGDTGTGFGIAYPGNGGNAIFGGGGLAFNEGPGGNANNFGGGGGGAGSQNTGAAVGGDGSAGVVVVTEYI